MKWVTNKIEKATDGTTIFSVIHICNDVSRDQICIIWWYTLVTKLIIQLRNKNHVSQNLTLVIRLSNENLVSPNLSLVIRCGDTVIRSLFTEFAFAAVNLNLTNFYFWLTNPLFLVDEIDEREILSILMYHMSMLGLFSISDSSQGLT